MTVDSKAEQLFKAVQEHYPSSALGDERWQVLTLAAIAASGRVELAGELYKYLTSQPEYTTSAQRQALVRRLRETLVKAVPIVGTPRVIEACFSIGENEREEDKDYSFSREHWKSGPENVQRGMDWFHHIYRADDAKEGGTKDKMAAHKDIRWLSIEITYGLFMSDHSIIDGIDTETVAVTGIILQNCPVEAGWHLRGLRRAGAGHDEVEKIHQCVEKIAAFTDVKLLPSMPRVKDIEHEV